MSRLFDPIAFMNESTPQNATRRDPRPQGEAIGQITDLKWEDGIVKKQDSRNFGQPWYRMTAVIEVTDPEYLATRPNGTGDKEIFNYGIMYDGDETGRPKVGPNININLGKFRDACGANGKPYSACIGQFVRIMVINKPHPTDPEAVLDEVKGVTKA